MKYAENEKFDHLIRLALLDCGDKDAEMFRAIDTSNAVVSRKLRNRIHRLIKRKEREHAVKKTKRILGRAAIAAMLILSIVFAAMMSISAIRDAIWRPIVEWHEEYISIHYDIPENDDVKDSDSDGNGETNSNSNSNSNSNETDIGDTSVVTPPKEILEVRKPTYIPEGFVEDVTTLKHGVFVDYYQGEEFICSFSQLLLNDRDSYYNSQTAVIDHIMINGYKAMVITYDQTPEVYLIWNDGEYEYTLFSVITLFDDMIKIAESVK